MEVSKLFTVTPMSRRFELEPGGTYEGAVTVINPADATESFDYKVYVAPYGVVGDEYSVDMLTESSYSQIKDWITIEKPTGSLQPNQSDEVHYTIKVPKDVPAGGQYAAIVVSQNDETKAAEEGNNVAVKDIFELASLIYGEVRGETVHKGEILENNIPGFVTEAPIMVEALVSNDGNIHENAEIKIRVTDALSGRLIVGGDESVAGDYSEIVMPETTRKISREIKDDLPILGIVHVEQKIAYNGETSEVARDVIICPAWFMVLIGVVLSVIVAIIVRIVLKDRKKKREVERLGV